MYSIKLSTLLTTVIFLMSSAGWAQSASMSDLLRQDTFSVRNKALKDCLKENHNDKSLCVNEQRAVDLILKEGQSSANKQCDDLRNDLRKALTKARTKCSESGVKQCYNVAVKCAAGSDDSARSEKQLQNQMMSVLGQLAPQFGPMLGSEQYVNNCSGLNATDWDKREDKLKNRLKDIDSKSSSLQEKIQSAAEDKASKQSDMLGDMNTMVSQMDEERQKAKEEQRQNDLRFAQETHQAADSIRNMEMKQIEIQGSLLEISIKRGNLSSGLASNLLDCRMKYEAARTAEIQKPGHGAKVHSGLSGASLGASQDSTVANYKLCVDAAKRGNDSAYQALAQQEQAIKKSQSDLQASIAEQKDILQKQNAAAAQRAQEFSDLQIAKEKAFYQKQQNLITKFNSTTQLADKKVQDLTTQVSKLRMQEIQETNSVNLLGERPKGESIPRDALDAITEAHAIEQTANEYSIRDPKDESKDCISSGTVDKFIKSRTDVDEDVVDKVLKGDDTIR